MWAMARAACFGIIFCSMANVTVRLIERIILNGLYVARAACFGRDRVSFDSSQNYSNKSTALSAGVH